MSYKSNEEIIKEWENFTENDSNWVEDDHGGYINDKKLDKFIKDYVPNTRLQDLQAVKEMVEGAEKEENWRRICESGIKATEATSIAFNNEIYNQALQDIKVKLDELMK